MPLPNTTRDFGLIGEWKKPGWSFRLRWRERRQEHAVDAQNNGGRPIIAQRKKHSLALEIRQDMSRSVHFFTRLDVHSLKLVQAGSHGQMEDVIHDLQHAGYDLQGVDEEALSAAVAKEWQRREQLREQRIWTYATVTAPRLAAQHVELQEAERLFYKARMDHAMSSGLAPVKWNPPMTR